MSSIIASIARRLLREERMCWLLEICLFVVGIAAGLLLGGLVPDRFMPKSRRIPIGAFLVGLAACRTEVYRLIRGTASIPLWSYAGVGARRRWHRQGPDWSSAQRFTGRGLSPRPYRVGQRANSRFMFQAMVTRLHSPRTRSSPRSRNCRNPSTDLMMPNTGSGTCLRSA